MKRVVHVIAALSRGGAGRALLTAAGALTDAHHTIASLQPADRLMAERASVAGIELLDAPDEAPLRAALERADIVQLHFWNAPEVYDLLSADLPEMRLVVWSHVSGAHPPQVITPELLDVADEVVATSAATTELPGLSHLAVVPSVADPQRVEGLAAAAHDGYVVGYIGTLDFAKLHPGFVAMSAEVAIPEARFAVHGTGGALADLQRQVAEHCATERFEFHGYTEDIRGALERMDVFGYPLAPWTSATSELILQEVMHAGVPPVVLAAGAARAVVEHGRTGLLADDPREYRAAIERLHADPDLRGQLGAAARAHAIRTWSPQACAAAWSGVYERAMQRPKRSHRRPELPSTGAGRFVQSLGGSVPEFVLSMNADEPEAVAAERAIAGSPDVLVTGAGGILSYRDRYPDDPHLRLWSGLALHSRGRAVPAVGEITAAIRLGLDNDRTRAYLAEVTPR